MDPHDRANAVIARLGKLDDTVANLIAFRFLLEDLASRPPMELPPIHRAGVFTVRAGILRTAIALAVATVDQNDPRGTGASLGEIINLLKDSATIDLIATSYPRLSRRKIRDVRSRYNNVSCGPLVQGLRRLRLDEIAHILAPDTPTPETAPQDIFLLTDKVVELVTALCDGLGIPPPNFLGQQASLRARALLFWRTYFSGVNALR